MTSCETTVAHGGIGVDPLNLNNVIWFQIPVRAPPKNPHRQSIKDRRGLIYFKQSGPLFLCLILVKTTHTHKCSKGIVKSRCNWFSMTGLEKRHCIIFPQCQTQPKKKKNPLISYTGTVTCPIRTLRVVGLNAPHRSQGYPVFLMRVKALTSFPFRTDGASPYQHFKQCAQAWSLITIMIATATDSYELLWPKNRHFSGLLLYGLLHVHYVTLPCNWILLNLIVSWKPAGTVQLHLINTTVLCMFTFIDSQANCN